MNVAVVVLVEGPWDLALARLSVARHPYRWW